MPDVTSEWILFVMPSSNMEPTIRHKDLLMTIPLRLARRPPVHRDVIAFDVTPPTESFKAVDPSKPKITFIMRVVGVGGDTIEIRDGKLFRNGEQVEEPYADIERHPMDPNRSAAASTVPKNMLYVLGDNRGNSNDSRQNGPVPMESVRGIARYIGHAVGGIAAKWQPL